MPYTVTLLQEQLNIQAQEGESLLHVLRQAGVMTDAPCGGNGRCGKCRVSVNGQERLACQTKVREDMTVELPVSPPQKILTEGICMPLTAMAGNGYRLTFDIGTTTVAGYLLDGESGKELASASSLNPQTAYGADVISRIRIALNGQQDALTLCIRKCVESLTAQLCQSTGISPEQIRLISIVGNPAMRQLFLGISLENLARIPFSPVLRQVTRERAEPYLPLCKAAELLTIPDISGFVGADALACVLATGMDKGADMTLMVDIGTNGEMVMGSRDRMAACSTAAGPALEGANISCGMRGQPGAIDHVSYENGSFRCSVIGGGEATGICGSGLIDAVAAALEAGMINQRGRILLESRVIFLTETVFLTQEDIRQVQLAKGAIAAGIRLMAQHLEIRLENIQKVSLAGAFGTYMDPSSACRIGLLPRELQGKTLSVGNAAGTGGKMLALDPGAAADAQQLAQRIEFLELASVPGFQHCFAQCMRF